MAKRRAMDDEFLFPETPQIQLRGDDEHEYHSDSQ